MSGQLHITHGTDYLDGVAQGRRDALNGSDYRPHAGSTDRDHAYSQGYADGWAEALPCNNGTCGHLAHTPTA